MLRRRPAVAGILAGSPDGLRLMGDVLAAAVVIGVFWVPSTVAAEGSAGQAVGWVLSMVTGAAVLLRRLLPTASTVAAGVATVVGNALGVCEDPMFAMAWCMYPLAVARAARTRNLVLIFVGLLAVLAAVTGVPPGDATGVGQRLVVAVAALSVTWLFGITVGRQIAGAREAERVRVQLAVARDVHDVVGHALGLISAEAGVTRGFADAGEQELRDSLADIEKHARGALEDMQALVRGLRATPGDGAGPATAPGSVANLASLVDASRTAGISVEARILDGRQVDEVVGAVVFRMVQEALSNVVRHAPGAACTVDVRQEGDDIVVTVRDGGPGARPGGRPGFGLAGMQERARLIGGAVTWGNHPEGGFEVSARLPVPGGGR